jgi:hypothetical protein
MASVRLHRLLTTPIARKSKSLVVFWFSLSLTFATIFALWALKQGFSSEYVVQDDARQHVFWMQRFLDPALFPNDLIADYFQSVAPSGYTAVYRLMADVGVNPLVLNKFLPLVLGAIATGYCFGVSLQILPVPATGFIASLLLNQNLWMRDDLISATPVAFVYPLFLAFLYYLLRRSLLPCLVAIALQALFYPQCVFVCAGILILRLLRWEGSWLSFSQERTDYLFCAAGLGVALLVMLPYLLNASEFGPVIAATEAKKLAAFSEQGWSRFFIGNSWDFWLCGKRSGILPPEWCPFLKGKHFPLVPPQIWAGLSLPFLLQNSSRFPLVKQVKREVVILPQIALASIGMFFAAHVLLFRLHLPNRYTEHSLRVLMALAGAIALSVLLDALLLTSRRQANLHKRGQQFFTLGLIACLGTGIVLYPSLLIVSNLPFPRTNYLIGQVPALYKFLSEQPKDSLIASVAQEANQLPIFAQRSILVGGEGYALPYHKGYYSQIYQRSVDLIEAQYSPELTQVQRFIQKYGVDFWLLERAAFTPEYVVANTWIEQYQPTAVEVLSRLNQGTIPALVGRIDQCSVFETGELILLQATCIASLPQE